MPASIEINHPHPGDIVGGTVEVDVSWDLDLPAGTPVPPNTDGRVKCLDDGAELFPDQPLNINVLIGSQTVNFTFTESIDDVQFTAILRINGVDNAATDSVEGVEVEMAALSHAGADTITIVNPP